MTLLSLYSHHNRCQVALKTGNQLFAESIELTPTISQAMVLVPLIQQVWQQADNPSIDAIITARGPGAFTSLRVTLATAQGLALAFPQAQIFAPTHFEVLGYAAKQAYKGPILVLIDSKRGDWYGKIYDDASDIQVFNPKDLRLFLGKNPDYRLIADFAIDEEFEPFSVMQQGTAYHPSSSRGAISDVVIQKNTWMATPSSRARHDEKPYEMDWNDGHSHNLAVTNFAIAQLELFEDKNLNSLQTHPQNQQLKPYYYYQPAYAKKR